MTLLVNAVKFRLLAEELSKNEFKQFILKTIQLNGRDFILKSLFNALVNSDTIQANDIKTDYESSAVQKQQYLNQIVDTISDIIQSREETCDKSHTISKVDQLSYQIIGEMASYLNQYDYIRFSLCNRSTYIGCNTPNTLQLLDLLSTNNYSSINMALYPSIRSLFVKMSDYEQLKLSSNNHKLEILRLEMNHITHITPLLQLNTANMLNLYSLSIESCGTADHPFDVESFYKLLRLFPMITQLRLFNITMNHNNSKLTFGELFPRLTTLALFGTNVDNVMLDAVGEQLECLMMDRFAGNSFEVLSRTNFNKLRRLMAVLPTVQAVESIFKTAPYLTDINIVPKAFDNQLMSDAEIKCALSTIITQQSALKALYIGMDADKFELMIAGIECGMFKTRQRKRKEFKIWFNLNYVGCHCDAMEHQKFVIYISRIINALNIPNIEQFALIWEITFDCEDKVRDYQKQLMMDLSYFVETSPNIKLVESTATKTIIANVDCRMTSFNKFWEQFGETMNFRTE